MDSIRFSFLATLVVGFTLVLASLIPRLSSNQETSPQDKKMMEQMMKYGTPGKNHEFLKQYVGRWDVDTTIWQNPGVPPTKSKGAMKNELIFDGRYVKCEFEGDMSGMKFLGLEIIGYDLFKNKYTTFWIDSWSTSFLTTSGTLDAAGKVLTETGIFPDMMTDGKEMQKIKNVTTFLGDGKFLFEMFMIMPDGKEAKSMELACTRKI